MTRVLFDAAHAVRRGELSCASTCLRTVSGHWLRVEATALAVDDADIAVVLQPAAVHQLLGALAACNKLTAREYEVLGLLAHGLAGKQIARVFNPSHPAADGTTRSGSDELAHFGRYSQPAHTLEVSRREAGGETEALKRLFRRPILWSEPKDRWMHKDRIEAIGGRLAAFRATLAQSCSTPDDEDHQRAVREHEYHAVVGERPW